MYSNISRIKEKILKVELSIGSGFTYNDPEVAETMCETGIDFVWIDGEHGPLDKRNINLTIMAVISKGVAPFVRVSWNDPVLVKPILEMGPAAIIFPFIKTVEDAKLAVSSCKYPPQGIRGFGPRRANYYSTMENREYLELAKSEPWVILQIEHIDGVNNLEEILRVDGVDSIVVGSNDLSASIGLLGQVRHPEVIKLLDKISKVCNNAKIPFGAAVGSNSEDNISDWIKRKVNWLAVDVDYIFLINGCENAKRTALRLFQKIRVK